MLLLLVGLCGPFLEGLRLLPAQGKEIEGVRGGKEGQEDEGEEDQEEGQGRACAAGAAEGPHCRRQEDDDDE